MATDAKSSLKIFSILELVLAAVNAVTLIIPWAQGQLSVSYIMEQATQMGQENVTEQIAKISIYSVIGFAVLSILILLFLGIQGLRQCSGQNVGSAHIVIARICFVFLALAALVEILALFNSPNKDWIGTLSALGSVLLCFYYIRIAKTVRDEMKLSQ